MTWAELMAEFEIKFGMPVPGMIQLGPIKVRVTLLPNGSLFLDPHTVIATQEEFAEFLQTVGGNHAATVAGRS